MEASESDQTAALERLKKIQNKVGKTMRDTGKDEKEFDQLLQDEK